MVCIIFYFSINFAITICIFYFYPSMKNLFTIISIAVCIQACQQRSVKDPNALVTNSNKPDALQSHIHDSIKAHQDFFQYANGGWLKKHPIPASESSWGIFQLVEKEINERIKKISESATATINAKKGTNTQLIGDFFSAAMDSLSAENAGTKYIQPYLQSVEAITNQADVIKNIAAQQALNFNSGFGLYISADNKNSAKNILYLCQGGLSLPDKEFYFATDASTTAKRNAFPTHIANIFVLAGADSIKAKSMANAVFNLEKKIANLHRSLEALRIPEKNYNKLSLTQAQSIVGTFPLSNLLSSLSIITDTLSINQPEFFVGLGNLLSSENLDTWKAYLKWQYLSNAAPVLTNAFVQESFSFNEKIMNGVTELKPRWERVLEDQENALGDALGQLYVKQYFSQKTKQRYINLTDSVISSFRQHILELDWMSSVTKDRALKKLNTIVKKIGYPDKWRNYSSMSITRESYFKNSIEVNKWKFADQISKINKPVDKQLWDMTPQTYNAYYNPSNNEIVIPAAILIAPGYKDEELDDALVYGYVGASTIGHEITHGFDDEGRKFDELGNMNNWWTTEDATKFEAKAARLIQQFNNYTLLDNKHPNGTATLGENIADLGGLVIAYDAFKKTKQFKEGKSIAGLTPAQRYFMGYAFGWMEVRTDEKQAALLLSDVHAPIFLRVNGPMSNCDAWYQAFNVQKGSPMWRDSADRVRIW
jgi:putative endopeptidase